jgi:transcriptional regulator with AAA-type ATPase domain
MCGLDKALTKGTRVSRPLILPKCCKPCNQKKTGQDKDFNLADENLLRQSSRQLQARQAGIHLTGDEHLSSLFIGPSGTGKTMVAGMLADDMSSPCTVSTCARSSASTLARPRKTCGVSSRW